jgi:hypothetical protein
LTFWIDLHIGVDGVWIEIFKTDNIIGIGTNNLIRYIERGGLRIAEEDVPINTQYPLIRHLFLFHFGEGKEESFGCASGTLFERNKKEGVRGIIIPKLGFKVEGQHVWMIGYDKCEIDVVFTENIEQPVDNGLSKYRN